MHVGLSLSGFPQLIPISLFNSLHMLNRYVAGEYPSSRGKRSRIKRVPEN